MNRPGEGVIQKVGAPDGGGEPRVEEGPPSLIQAIAGDMKRGLLLLGLALGGVAVTAAFLGALVAASLLASIVLVSLTLYAFLSLWPEEETRTPPPSELPGGSQPRPRAAVAGVRVDGPPRVRVVMALREMASKQDSFRISREGAQRFAKTIRYILRSARE